MSTVAAKRRTIRHDNTSVCECLSAWLMSNLWKSLSNGWPNCVPVCAYTDLLKEPASSLFNSHHLAKWWNIKEKGYCYTRGSVGENSKFIPAATNEAIFLHDDDYLIMRFIDRIRNGGGVKMLSPFENAFSNLLSDWDNDEDDNSSYTSNTRVDHRESHIRVNCRIFRWEIIILDAKILY